MIPSLMLFASLWLGQTTLQDSSVAVITTDGLFLVLPGTTSRHLVTPAGFGVTQLDEPSVSWVRGTDVLFVTSRNTQGAGGLWRVEVNAGLATTVVDLTPNLPLAQTPDLSDTDYVRGLDQLFVLDRASSSAHVLPDPVNATGAELTPWQPTTVPGPSSMAVHGPLHPTSAVVVGGDEIHLQRDDGTVKVLFDGEAGRWDEVETNHVNHEYYVLNANRHDFGRLFKSGGIGPSAFLQQMNVSGFCSKPVRRPVDMEWDTRHKKIVVLGEDGVAGCLFGGVAQGPNHVVRMPAVGGGPTNNVPVLLTSVPASGITGVDGDLTLIRSSGPEVIYFGEPGESGAGVSPKLQNNGFGNGLETGKTSTMTVTNAPANAVAFLVFGMSRLSGVTHQDQTVYPSVDVLLPLTTDGSGEATYSFATPNDPALLDLTVYIQWWIRDTTTPHGGDLVASHGAAYTVGK